MIGFEVVMAGNDSLGAGHADADQQHAHQDCAEDNSELKAQKPIRRTNQGAGFLSLSDAIYGYLAPQKNASRSS